MHDGNGPATPTAEELIARAKALIPVLAERAPRQEQARRILDETIADLQTAGFFRIVQPKRWGGYEMSPSVLAEVQMTLAQGDMSVGWVMGIIAVHPFELALFDDRAAQDVWGKDSGVLVGSSYMPTGKATPTEGGFRFSGRWRFSSGSDHCRWLFLGGAVQSSDPSQGLDYRTFLVPIEDCELIDTWQVFGLKGTGSKDVVVRDAFVPAYRTTQAKDILGGSMPGLALNTAPLYRMPYAQVFLRVVSTAALGALQGMLDVFREVGSQRVAVMGNRTAKDPDAQLACAQAMVEIAEMKLVLHHNFARIFALAERNEVPSVTDRLLYKYQSAAVPERCAVLASQLFEASGGTGVFETSPLGRFYRDILTARQHAGNQVPAFGRNLGATLLGLENPDFYF